MLFYLVFIFMFNVFSVKYSKCTKARLDTVQPKDRPDII